MSLKEIISANWKTINERASAACERSSRSPKDVRIIAVTKSVGEEETNILIELGAKEVGESRVVEAAKKFSSISCEGKSYRRHLIGHLQRNKVRLAMMNFDYFHSVDSLRLAQELEKEAAKLEKKLPVLLQVNVAGETQKYGFAPNVLEEILKKVTQHSHLQIEGLMTMAPKADNVESIRPIFCQLRELRDSLSPNFPNLKQLSMGMTQDFEVAIEEGATMVRVGSALFEGLAED